MSVSSAEEESDEAAGTEFPDSDQESANYVIRYSPNCPECLSLFDPLALLDDLRSLGDCKTYVHLEDVPPLEKLHENACSIWWEILLTKVREEGDIDRLKGHFYFCGRSEQCRGGTCGGSAGLD